MQVRHGDCGLTHSIKVQRKNVTRTPIFYRLEKMGKENVPVGYVRIKEFNALARKDLIIGIFQLSTFLFDLLKFVFGFCLKF